ncbi:MAG: glycosyltransferase [Thermoguttaceae bacterium]
MTCPLRVFTWHIHGNYLWYLSYTGHHFYLPVDRTNHPGYGGRGRTFPFGHNVHDVPVDQIARCPFDCILYQHRDNWERGRRWLSPSQEKLPSIYLEHDPPLESPTDELHWYDNPAGLLVHVTPFNALMWDSGRTPCRVIEHGVPCHRDVEYTGEIARGLTVANNLGDRGRRLGPDVFAEARRRVPLDLVGMGSEPLGGLGEVLPPQLAAFEARYRFLFNPIRYTSLGLAVCEAMMLGMPVVGLATTEMASAVVNGVTGFIDTSLDRLIEPMQWLLREPAEARRMGRRARQLARERFSLGRFVHDWNTTFADVTNTAPLRRPRRRYAETHRND